MVLLRIVTGVMLVSYHRINRGICAALLQLRTPEVPAREAPRDSGQRDGFVQAVSVGVRELPAQNLQPQARCAFEDDAFAWERPQL